MQPPIGAILKSVSSEEEDYFDDTLVLLVEHNADGTVGVVLNRTYGRDLTDLVAFKHAPKIELFEGGPVQQDHLYFIHRMTDIGGSAIKETMYFGGDFEKALTQIQQNKAHRNTIKIFVGYCGWDVGQLGMEIESGAWEMMEMSMEEMFAY